MLKVDSEKIPTFCNVNCKTMPTAKKKVKKKQRKPSFTFPKAARYRVTSHDNNGVVNNNNTSLTSNGKSRYLNSWNAQYHSTYKHHIRMTSSTTSQLRQGHGRRRGGGGSGLDFNRLMHLNNRVVAKLNMLEISGHLTTSNSRKQVSSAANKEEGRLGV